MGYQILSRFSSLVRQIVPWRSKNRGWLLLAIAPTAVGLAGCSAIGGAKNSWQYNSSWNSIMTGYRNDAWATKSWHAKKHQFCREAHLHEFCEGFKAGYMSIAEGTEGCSPAFPPRQYWGWKYQSAEGQAKVAAWYAGYPHGARAADEDGIGNWQQIQTSTNVQKNLQDQGMLGPGQTPGMYPMPAAQPLAAIQAKKLKEDQAANASLLSESASPSDQNASNSGQYLRK